MSGLIERERRAPVINEVEAHRRLLESRGYVVLRINTEPPEENEPDAA
ncbi:hypothetical protein PBI_BIGNUZ_59 [Mycobacterium phage BigNuz]|uniref:Uncharacterized protein n=2 Tax=Bignuzvirus bignuz TaxID=1983736 RepID=G1JX74_9CAUD|nr:hypothetical protein PBI_BIGNUZ_59 [Mycobacterium phage BigNuz]AEL98221.1 hypothetical protein PBI_BIGNUZ_59 [Mycobacterium phage BigNuz]AOT24899.1 hypothetical protein PBI_NAZO_60 [Mycobacterium phage Nazo]